jgi:hypothetical protein
MLAVLSVASDGTSTRRRTRCRRTRRRSSPSRSPSGGRRRKQQRPHGALRQLGPELGKLGVGGGGDDGGQGGSGVAAFQEQPVGGGQDVLAGLGVLGAGSSRTCGGV